MESDGSKMSVKNSEKHFKNMVIAPHIDDEVFGCGGILDDSFYVYFCGVEKFRIISRKERVEEIKTVQKFLGYHWTLNLKSEVNHYTVQDFIPLLENEINNIRPDTIYIPYPSYNQDHQTIYSASQIALRPHDTNHFVKNVYIYESMDFLWKNEPYVVNRFADIGTKGIERKLHAYQLHRSQVRGHRKPSLIKALACIRGTTCNCDYAEAFVIGRQTV